MSKNNRWRELKELVQFDRAGRKSQAGFDEMLRVGNPTEMNLFASVARDMAYEWATLTRLPGFVDFIFLDELVLAGRMCGCDLAKRPCGALIALGSLMRRMRGDNWQ